MTPAVNLHAQTQLHTKTVQLHALVMVIPPILWFPPSLPRPIFARGSSWTVYGRCYLKFTPETIVSGMPVIYHSFKYKPNFPLPDIVICYVCIWCRVGNVSAQASVLTCTRDQIHQNTIIHGSCLCTFPFQLCLQWVCKFVQQAK